MLYLLIGTALAWDSIGATWAEMPVPYWVSSDLGSSLDDAEALTAIQAGFSAWEAAGCGAEFRYEGRLDGAAFGEAQDGRNAVFLVEQGWSEEASLLSAPSIYTAGAEIAEADIGLNGQYFAWSTEGDGAVFFDVQAAVTHEVGHLLGLWHSTVADASLNPSLNGNPEARSLAEDDIEGLCTLYAASSGDAAFGEPCTESTDCESGLFCLADGADRYCSQSCDDGACPGGYECLDLLAEGSACAQLLDDKACAGCASGGDAGLWLGVLGLGVVRRRWGRRDNTSTTAVCGDGAAPSAAR